MSSALADNLQPQPQKRRKLDLAVLRVNDMLQKHPEYSSTECHVALAVALHMRRHDDGFYHATLRQGDAGALVKEVRKGRFTILRALRKLCASGGIFKATPRYGQRGRLANDYVLIEAPKAYERRSAESAGAEVVEFTPAKPSAAQRVAAQKLAHEYGEWYLKFRGQRYEPCPLDMKHALLLLREFGDHRAYLETLLGSWLDRGNDGQLTKVYKLPEAHQARLLYQARPYLKLIHQEWVAEGADWVPEALRMGAK